MFLSDLPHLVLCCWQMSAAYFWHSSPWLDIPTTTCTSAPLWLRADPSYCSRFNGFYFSSFISSSQHVYEQFNHCCFPPSFNPRSYLEAKGEIKLFFTSKPHFYTKQRWWITSWTFMTCYYTTCVGQLHSQFCIIRNDRNSSCGSNPCLFDAQFHTLPITNISYDLMIHEFCCPAGKQSTDDVISSLVSGFRWRTTRVRTTLRHSTVFAHSLMLH